MISERDYIHKLMKSNASQSCGRHSYTTKCYFRYTNIEKFREDQHPLQVNFTITSTNFIF